MAERTVEKSPPDSETTIAPSGGVERSSAMARPSNTEKARRRIVKDGYSTAQETDNDKEEQSQESLESTRKRKESHGEGFLVYIDQST